MRTSVVFLLGIFFIFAGIASGLLGNDFYPPLIIAGFAICALGFQSSAHNQTFAFTFWVFTLVAAGMFYPAAFTSWGAFELRQLIIPLIVIIMFGMGTTLQFSDFLRVIKIPKAILIGMFLQFSIMPLTGALLASLFGFEAAIAAGIILVGSCPGGVASNVMTYIAKGNVALSITMTACSTLASPVLTPLIMKLLAGHYIEIEFFTMMITIIQIILVPIFGGLLFNKILRATGLYGAWLEKLLSITAMASICFILAIIVALSRDDLLQVGLALIMVSVLHNVVGYSLGYWGAAAIGLNEAERRTVAIEVGMQNSGMATGLAINVLKSPQAALAPAIFGPWMNISGSALASWWRSQPVVQTAGASTDSSVLTSPSS